MSYKDDMREIINKALEATGGNKALVARILDISWLTVHRYADKKYGKGKGSKINTLLLLDKLNKFNKINNA